ncbi:methyltransferase domain-containing protein [Arthrobacter sp. JZ12]|uniref:MerR family transcriptional regulator n=1 Tax=Arthrobacter sp. JZ12 TaxID=2654190 RepID=UPI002B49CF1F|nr:methyltransferase domain-containing protein [Arthrobacter sp. JZ12]WRH25731.1 methyltransferase domain-containing protein [Arthrobacter sp. JZ12]
MASESTAEAVAERVFSAALGAMEILAIHLGDRLGWYRCLAGEGPSSSSELAQRTGTSERYAREWLEQQAVTGYLTADDDGGTRRFSLPAGAAEVLTDENSLNYLAPLARMIAGAAVQLPALHRAYRNGTGVSWQEFGDDARQAQADMNRPWFEHELENALRQAPDLVARLEKGGATIADIGCGAGWSTIALGRAFPDASVSGFDIDAESVDLARANAAGAGNGVEFQHIDASGLPEGQFDVVFAFECIHDMPYPVEVLSAARRSLRAGGTVVVMDEAVAEIFDPPGDEVERLMYGFSLLICLPDGMSHPDSAGTGTVMRPATLRKYAAEAGFSDARTLPIHDFGFFRFYELVS